MFGLRKAKTDESAKREITKATGRGLQSNGEPGLDDRTGARGFVISRFAFSLSFVFRSPNPFQTLLRTRKLKLAATLAAILAAILLALLAWFIFGNRGGSLKDIQARGVWRVGMDPSFPPFENLDVAAGEVVGLDADLARALGAELKIKTEIVSLGFDELVDAVAAHRIDAAISALPYIPERTQDVRFSDPYVQAGIVLAAAKGVPPGGSAITGTADLAGRRVAVEWGSQGDAEARRLLADGKLTFRLAPQDTVTAALDLLASGGADAALVDAISLALYPQTEKLVAVGEPLVSDPYVVAVAHDAPDLLKAINASLRELESNGTLDGLRKRWLHP